MLCWGLQSKIATFDRIDVVKTYFQVSTTQLSSSYFNYALQPVLAPEQLNYVQVVEEGVAYLVGLGTRKESFSYSFAVKQQNKGGITNVLDTITDVNNVATAYF